MSTAAVIWKFPFEIDDSVEIEMPLGARVLYVDQQHGRPCLWAACESDQPLHRRRFYVRGTGHSLGVAQYSGYVGSFQMLDGALVWHVFGDTP
jgi:hypothetical protein